MEPDFFSWSGKKLFIPPARIKEIIRQSLKKDISVFFRLLKENKYHDVYVLGLLKPFGGRLADILACIKGMVVIKRISKSRRLVFYANKKSVIVFPRAFYHPNQYFVAGFSYETPSLAILVKDLPVIRYKDLNENLNDFMNGFFSDGMGKLTKPIDKALSEGCCTISPIAEKTSHKYYFIFGYLLRKALLEKTVKSEIRAHTVLWRHA